MKEITFITGNAEKARYLSDYFHRDVTHKKLDLHEIQSLDLAEVVTDKVKRAYKIVGSPVLVEDVSLEFAELNNLPGPLIRWFDETLGNEKLCSWIGENRNITARVMYALYDGTAVQIFEGVAHGTVADSPRGETNFGWDPIFIPEGHTLTWAEMTADEKHATAMRKPALEKLAAYLETN